MVDDRTTNLNLPLPHPSNVQLDDVERLRQAFTAVDTAIAGKQASLGFTPQNVAQKGQANGYASLDSEGKVPAGQLPSYVDDVVEVADPGSLPSIGAAGKIYISLSDGLQWRWSGSAYIQIVSSPGSTDSVPEGVNNKYFTNARAEAAMPMASLSTAGKTLLSETIRERTSAGHPGLGYHPYTGNVTFAGGETSINVSSVSGLGAVRIGATELFLNGVRLKDGADYTLSPNGIFFALADTINFAGPMFAGDQLDIIRRF